MDLAHGYTAQPRVDDREAFMVLIGPTLPQAFRLATAMLGNTVDAEDAVQESVVSAWRHRDRFQSASPVAPWFLTIVANRCRSYRRNRWWAVSKGITLPDRASADADGAPAIDLRRALYRLSRDERLVLVLRYYLDLPLDEVAAILGTTSKAARNRVHRALARLRLLPEVAGE